MPPSKTVHAVCSHDCPDSCAVLVTIDELGKATRVQGDPAHPVTRGFLCAKVAKYLDRVYSPVAAAPPHAPPARSTERQNALRPRG